MTRGPVAPKDPVKKRESFYIMYDKEISAAKQPNGKGIQPIYLNDGRLVSSAQIVGNVTNQTMLDMLVKTADFRKLVHSIGVSIITYKQEDEAEFVLQMYGKKDLYGSGTLITRKITTDGMENVIELEKVSWSDDDDIVGQLRFEFPDACMANVSVRFYLQDGFKAPVVEQDAPIDYKSDAYQKMIQQSLMLAGNNYRLKKAIDKARKGKPVTMAFIGGSITQGAGATPLPEECYARKTYENFKKTYAMNDNVTFVKAGVGGTPSELGMIRYEREVLDDGSLEPDIVVVEFAVNDEGDETKGVCFESLVRKILYSPGKPAVILLFAVFADDTNLQERLAPIGRQYNLPMVSLKNAVTEQFTQSREEGRVLSKNQYFYDRYHPSNVGHRIMTDCLCYLFQQVDGAVTDLEEDYTTVRPVLGAEFENVKLLDKKDNFVQASISCGAFTATDTDLQCVERNTNAMGTPEFPYNWMKEENVTGESFQMEITCKALVLVHKDSAVVSVGKADVFVDGKYVRTADPHINNWTHCNPLVILNEKKSTRHQVEIRMAEGDEKKSFTILGFGYVE